MWTKKTQERLSSAAVVRVLDVLLKAAAGLPFQGKRRHDQSVGSPHDDSGPNRCHGSPPALLPAVLFKIFRCLCQYSVIQAELETEYVWQNILANAELTGVWADDIVAVANTQLNYQESEANYFVEEDGVKQDGYNRYAAWYTGLDEEWCRYLPEERTPYDRWNTLFAAFCVRNAGLDEGTFPIESDCLRWIEALKEAELFHENDGSYEPKAGDLAFCSLTVEPEEYTVGPPIPWASSRRSTTIS